MQKVIIKDHECGFDATGQLVIIYSAFVKYLRKTGEHNKTVQELIIGFNKGYDPNRMEVLYNTLIVFGITMKLARLIKMCQNDANSRIQVDQHLSHMFLIQNCLKQGDALSPLILNFL
jgi:hypothetical protein